MPVTVTGGRAAKKKTSKKSAAKKKAEQVVTATGEFEVKIDETAADASTDKTHEAVSAPSEDVASSEETGKRKRTSRKEKNLPEYPNVTPEDVINVVCEGIAQGMTEMTAEFLCEKLEWPTDPEALSALRQRYTNYRNGTKDSDGLGDDLPPLAHRPRGAAATKIDFDALRAKLRAAKGE